MESPLENTGDGMGSPLIVAKASPRRVQTFPTPQPAGLYRRSPVPRSDGHAQSAPVPHW